MESTKDTFSTSPPEKNWFGTQQPEAQLYLLKNTIGPRVINSIIHTKNLLNVKGIREHDIQEILIDEDPEEWKFKRVPEEVTNFLTKHQSSSPIIVVHNVFIGDVNQLEEWVVSGKMDTLIEEGLSEQPPPEPITPPTLPSEPVSKDTAASPSSAGFVDKAKETGKWAFSSLSAASGSFTNLTSWWASNPPKNSSDHKPFKQNANYTEFEVDQINWYWRSQQRILRFSDDQFVRLNPFTKELRAVHNYSTITKAILTGNNFVTIYFKNQAHPEYYQTPQVDKILEILAQHIPNFNGMLSKNV
mmetsp:Transcript_25638/g.36010  ORF Transcript_25638/g.36010 Transcript_25638/m.36010 type:complete len:302 (-) Transcript_25638:130-1035(-)|eukprot:CAMPEP_0168569782 /NCGR_PEP_ID=MMETSP0413-20121227/16361_1 /TAXON_ID=136452 /ORGANISM="Filamoeba nolandi, Strain NC-AS-23-1" /LENGTH=301 /DNA_ID=CAMNT_0008602341 /DNA_START=1319 /DNA_END=2224 /DNA_ORIENTATION=+